MDAGDHLEPRPGAPNPIERVDVCVHLGNGPNHRVVTHPRDRDGRTAVFEPG